jgi:hypothetical protein
MIISDPADTDTDAKTSSTSTDAGADFGPASEEEDGVNRYVTACPYYNQRDILIDHSPHLLSTTFSLPPATSAGVALSSPNHTLASTDDVPVSRNYAGPFLNPVGDPEAQQYVDTGQQRHSSRSQSA